MTEPYARLADAAIALENPSLSLLRQKMAPAVLATLTPVFESGQSSIPVDEFHARAAQVFAAVRDRDAQFSIDDRLSFTGLLTSVARQGGPLVPGGSIAERRGRCWSGRIVASDSAR
ncbi:MAG: hypothetical protein JWP07_2247 [Pseudonocardiales bacterium]|nr:hypothetical protein [Pseudonocardiales bacterium]